MLIIGIVVLLAGIGLCAAPVALLRGAAHLRFTGMPEHPTSAQVRTWRRAGALMAVVGSIAILAALL